MNSQLALFMETSKPLTIAEYAALILAHPRVQAALEQIEVSKRVAARFLNHASLWDVSMTPEEAPYIEHYREAFESGRHQVLQSIIQKMLPPQWLYYGNTEDIAQGRFNKERSPKQALGVPTRDDIPFILFWQFLTDPDFQVYFMKDELPWFSAALPTERELQFVLALFLWLKMDARYDTLHGLSYYVRARSDHSGLTLQAKQATSTVEDRLAFLDLFGEYIHTDLWGAQDYEEKAKQGIIMRLRFAEDKTGKVVVQSCGERTGTCNTLYTITESVNRTLRKMYLEGPSDSVSLLTRPSMTFKCQHCGCSDACLFSPGEVSRFYCDTTCYAASWKNR